MQQEQLAKGVRDMKQRHMVSFINTIEDGISKKLREKDTELENINRKNRELMERVKQVSAEAQNWHYRAKYSESVVNILKNNLQNAISQGADQGKEGFGDGEVDDATSYVDPINYLTVGGRGKSFAGPSSEHLTCRACRSREVSILLMPCRHLCVCKECDGFINVCPACNIPKSSSVEVFLS